MTSKIKQINATLNLADKYAERFCDWKRNYSYESHHDMIVFRNALEEEIRRLYEINEDLTKTVVSHALIKAAESYTSEITKGEQYEN